jgi:CBS domain-containing protein
MARIQNHVVRAVVSLDETATCAEAARIMSDAGIGSVGVLRGKKLVGLVTERDLLAAVGGGADPERVPVARALPPELAAVSPDATELEAAEVMRAHRTRHLAVVDRGEIVGVFSLLDLVELVVQDKQWSIDQLESYIRGGRAAQLSAPLRSVFSHDHAGVLLG